MLYDYGPEASGASIPVRYVTGYGPCRWRHCGFRSVPLFFQVVSIVTRIRKQTEFVDFDNLIAYPVQKIPVVSDHQQGGIRFTQVFLEPFGHFDVQVVGRFVQD